MDRPDWRFGRYSTCTYIHHPTGSPIHWLSPWIKPTGRSYRTYGTMITGPTLTPSHITIHPTPSMADLSMAKLTFYLSTLSLSPLFFVFHFVSSSPTGGEFSIEKGLGYATFLSFFFSFVAALLCGESCIDLYYFPRRARRETFLGFFFLFWSFPVQKFASSCFTTMQNF